MPAKVVVVVSPDVFLNPSWLEELPERSGLGDLHVEVREEGQRGVQTATVKVYSSSNRVFERIMEAFKDLIAECYRIFNTREEPFLSFKQLEPVHVKVRYGGTGTHKRGVTRECHRPQSRRRGRGGGLY